MTKIHWMKMSKSSIAAWMFIFSIVMGNFFLKAQAQVGTVTPGPVPTENQSEEQSWSQPVNLSRSGAASQPRIVSSPDGGLQAFWIDRFDGLMTSIYNGSTWSLPITAPFPPRRGGQKPVVLSTIPYLLADSQGRIHAFWYGDKDSKTGEPPLNYNQMQIGSISWSNTQQVAESALVFDVALTEADELALAYIRTLKTSEIPPGVYFRSTASNTKIWKPGSAVYSSIYFRILQPESAYLRVASSKDTAFVLWSEPRLSEMLYSDSLDGGVTWNTAVSLGKPEDRPIAPRIAIIPEGEVLRLWQASAQSGCVLYLQKSTIQKSTGRSNEPVATVPAGQPTPTPAPSIMLTEWTSPMRILEQMDFCPQSDRFWLQERNLYWIWGEGSPRINLSAWDDNASKWSVPQVLSFGFEEPESQRPVELEDLHGTMTKDLLTIIGKDSSTNEVWVTTSQVSTLELAYAPPSPWIAPISISSKGQTASNPTIAIDSQGRAHIVWIQGFGSTGASLFYARFEENAISNPSEIVRSAAGEFISQPELLVDSEDRLHLIWSGGEADQIFYTRAQADQAGSASGWLPARALSDDANTSGPQIVTDSAGQVLVLYAIPVNEKRGIYLVRSDDGGERWSKPEIVFDAAAAKWIGIDHPTLVEGADGILHMAFVQTQMPGDNLTLGIFYSRSTIPISIIPFAINGEEASDASSIGAPTATHESPSSETSHWIEPWELAPANSDWPRLAILGVNLHLLYANENGLNHRWLNLEQQTSDGGGWGSLTLVPGWQSLGGQVEFSSDRSPFGLAVDSQNLHLISPVPGSVDLRYSTLTTETGQSAGNRWSQPEVYHPIGTWINSPGGVASALITGGTMAVAWQASPPGIEEVVEVLPAAIYFSARIIPSVAAPPPIPLRPTAMPTPEPTSSPTVVPTPTPLLSMEPPPSEAPIPPLALGGGLAAIIVIAIFTGILLRGKKP